ncbi:hypothetical protein C2S53_010173 [Perilla frutescens var. hirtella]|uniref:Bifunctional inhibitor/plant lipid transfer protein/seed storage helical domain-containing protein n=1 Tax=Perilla frutescens var. hirtella TaxID=608512 RepID=A0AAD4NYR5_PERFH|nr:hypothetical protein C2S53_010173 [Perilla frutescens var. hirtella]
MEGSRIQSSSKLLLIILALVVVVGASAISAAKAKGNGGGDGTTCGMGTNELMECKPAVEAGSAEPPKPTALCCSYLKHANLTCFCTFKNNNLLPLIGINVTRAMELPSKCDPTQTANCA